MLIDIYREFLDSEPEPKPRLPIAIQFPINDICNSHCQMCHIWKKKKRKEISPDEIRTILSNPLFKEVKGVGINGGEPTLRKDIGDITIAVIETLPRIKSISLITNAILAGKVINSIKEVGTICKHYDVILDVMVSLDGVGEVHDRVRGTKGNFNSAVEVIDFILDSPFVGVSRIGCTVIRENVFDVDNVLQWCKNKGIYARFRLGIPHKRLYAENLKKPFQLNYEERYYFANFLDYLYYHYEKSELKRAFYRSLRDQIIYDQPRKAGCLWKNKGVTLTSEGKLAYCAVESNSIGNALYENSEELYWSNLHHRNKIVKDKCHDCRHDYDGNADRKIILMHTAKYCLNKLPTPIKKQATVYIGKALFQKEKARIKKAVRMARSDIGVRYVDLPKRMLITGWYGTETLGDKAILGGIVITIKDILPSHSIDVASIESYVTKMTSHHMPELNISDVISLDTAKRRVAKGDYCCVVIGGGPLMSSIKYCTDLLELFAHAKNIGAKTFIAGCGVGPLKSDGRNVAIDKLLEFSDIIALRDTDSLKLIKEKFGYSKPADTILDPAFIWVKKNLPNESVRNDKQILLALRDWPISEYAVGIPLKQAEQIKKHFEQELKKLVEELISVDPQVNIIPFCMHKLAIGGDDRLFYRRVFSEYPSILKNLDFRHNSPKDELKVIIESRAILAMRYHSVIFALATGTPFIAVDYTLGGKIFGLLKDLRSKDCMISLKDFDGKEIANRLWNQRFFVPGLKNKKVETENILTKLFQINVV